LLGYYSTQNFKPFIKSYQFFTKSQIYEGSSGTQKDTANPPAKA